MPQRALQPLDALALSFGLDFDAAVLVVAHPTAQSFERSALEDVVPEADALDPAPYMESASRQQNLTIILRLQTPDPRLQRAPAPQRRTGSLESGTWSLLMNTLTSHSYGASQIRLLRVTRRGDRHDLHDLTISVTVEGEIADAFIKGDNELLLPADTLRNTVNAIARDESLAEVELLGLALARHFMEHQPQFTRVRIELAEQPWTRLPVAGRAQGQAFTASNGERRSATVTSNGVQNSVVAGIEDFAIMKTSGAAFEGYLADQFTTLEAASDRVLAVSADAHWTYLHDEIAFGPYFQGVRQLLIEAFVQQPSRSAEHTAHAMAEVVLSSYADVGDVRVRLRQRSLPLVELAPFGLDNPLVLFRPEDAPELTAEVTLSR